MICKSNLSTYLPVSPACSLVRGREKKPGEKNSTLFGSCFLTKTFAEQEEYQYENYSHPISLKRKKAREREGDQCRAFRFFCVSSTRDFSVRSVHNLFDCLSSTRHDVFVLQIDVMFSPGKRSEVG